MGIAMQRLLFAALLGLTACQPTPEASDTAPRFEFATKAPWTRADAVIILDPYEDNALDMTRVASDPNVAGIIHKATEGLRTDAKFNARKPEAKALGLKWAGYMILTNDAPVDRQIDHFLTVAQPADGEPVFLDIECLSGRTGQCQYGRLSVSAAQIAAALDHFKSAHDREAILYMNHSTTVDLAKAFETAPPSYMPKLWYARYKRDVTGVFPIGPWAQPVLWQFVSDLNCSSDAHRQGTCFYQVPSTTRYMDINVFSGNRAALDAFWP